MKCPTCGYIGFEAADRCRNCGYDFTLISEHAAHTPELALRQEDTEGALRELDIKMEDRARASGLSDPATTAVARSADLDRVMRNLDQVLGEPPAPDLPLFDAGDADLPPMVSGAAAPRRPLAVRRATPDPARLRAKAVRHAPRAPQELELPLPEAAAPDVRPHAATIVRRDAPSDEPHGAPPLRRAVAATLDVVLMAGIDLIVVYFTWRMCGLTSAEFALLPPVPRGAVFLVVNGGYLAAFTAAGGQTIGKMALGLKVVGHADTPVSGGLAVVRAAGCLVSIASFGLGFVPALLAEGGRAVEDRLADTRVVRVSGLTREAAQLPG